MNQLKKLLPWIILTSLMVITGAALAQSGGDYEISRWTVDTGSALSLGGEYRLQGTAGQHDPATLQGGDYLLVGGFWRPALPGSFNGTLSLQGRTNHSGVEICGWDGGDLGGCTLTDASGAYSLPLREGIYDIKVETARYLDSEKTGIEVSAGGMTNLTSLTLKGGDVNDDDIVNILDLSFMGARYQCSSGDGCYDAMADPNDDGIVNILDLSMAGGNYQRTSPLPWP